MTELLDLAKRVVGWASAGEEVEAYVAHSKDTDVEVYQGGIETLSSAETDGVGIRVVLGRGGGRRHGFILTSFTPQAR